MQNHCGQHRLTTWGLQLVCRRELFKQNSPSMPQHGRMAQSLMAIYHLGHPAEKFFFRFPFKQFFPYFFPTWFMQQILLPFVFLPFTLFFKYIFSELPGEKCPLFLTKISCTLFCANKLLTIHIQNKNLLNENFHEKEDNVGSCLQTATIFYSSVLKEIAAYILPPTSVTPWTGALFGL